MKLLASLALAGLLLGTAAAHPQPFGPNGGPPGGPHGDDDRGLPPPPGYALPPDDEPPVQRMICIVQTPFLIERRCATYPGYPGSPCRCFGSFFEGTREVMY